MACTWRWSFALAFRTIGLGSWWASWLSGEPVPSLGVTFYHYHMPATCSFLSIIKQVCCSWQSLKPLWLVLSDLLSLWKSPALWKFSFSVTKWTVPADWQHMSGNEDVSSAKRKRLEKRKLVFSPLELENAYERYAFCGTIENIPCNGMLIVYAPSSCQPTFPLQIPS